MKIFYLLRCSAIRLFIVSALAFNCLPAFAVPIQPGVSLLVDQQFQACLDEAVLANGWIATEEVTLLNCSNHNIEFLNGIQFFTNLVELNLAGNRIASTWPLDQLPQLEMLDLSDNQLVDVYPLQMLNQLTQLNLGGNSQLQALDVQNIIQNNPGLTHIGVANIAMGDLNWLPPMGFQGEYNLVELDISYTGQFPGLYSTEQYPNLRVLKAAGNRLEVASPLEQLPQLKVLDLSDNQLVDVYPLQMMNNLSQLNLSGNSKLPALDVQTIIQNNPGLTHIGVANIAMNDLNWLPPMDPQGGYNLVELDISHIGVGSSNTYSDLLPVGRYPNLRVLKAAGNQLQTAYPLDQLAQLEILDVSDNQLVDVYPLQMMYNLVQLNLSGNSQLQALGVQTIIQNNPGLTHIGVANIAMNDLNWLPPMDPQGGYNLVELDISNIGTFFDLYPLLQYTNLRTLKAAGNQLQTAYPLDQLAQLEILDLSDNQLLDVYPLQSLHKLTQLNLSGNSQLPALNVQTIIQNNPGLTHIGVANIAMNDLNWLPPIGYQGEYNLVELDISNIGTFFDLYPLLQYTNLRTLKAAGNQLQTTYQLDQLAQLEILDLSDNQLVDVYPLQMMYNLVQLNLSGNSQLPALDVQTIIQNNPGLTHIGVANIAMNDLNWLPPMDPQGGYNLVELDISNTGTFFDLYPLLQYTNLRTLKAAGNQLQTTYQLDQLAQLEILDLSDNQLLDVYPLQNLHKLTQLNLSGNSQLPALNVQTIIQNNPGLTHIGVANIAMNDLNWLPPIGYQGEYNLVELDISNTGTFFDLYPLLQYTNLRMLKAAGNQLQSAKPVDQLAQLEILDLSDNQLVDVYPLQMMYNLVQLNLSGNSQLPALDVQTIIQNNPGLTHIGVANIAMNDLNWLPPIGYQGEYNLVELDISNTGTFFDLSPLLQYTNLRVLKAAGNQLQDIYSIGQLQQLEVVDLSNNDLQYVSPLGSIMSLISLDLRGNNNIQCAELDTLEAQLQAGVLLRPQSCIYLAPPEMAILSPIGAGPYFQTDSINFVANAYDVEDGNLDALVQWSSNIDGVLGTGASLGVSISAGEHIITATVVDSHGNTTSASINLSVQPNTAPQLNIQSIQDGAIFNDGEVVLLTADANDMEEGNISANIQWTSSLSGLLGTGSSVQAPLSVGSHVITASITDTAGVTVTQSVTIHINALPVLTLLSPQDGVVFNEGDFVALAGTANDVEDGNIDTTIQWTSSLSGFLGTGIDVQTPLSVGSHVITASITDASGVTVTQSVTIHINALPVLTLLSPQDGVVFNEGDVVALAGTANDVEDGNIDTTIQWTSSLSGFLGTGIDVQTPLSVGSHVITASITDASGVTVTQSVTIHINALPVLTLLSPQDGVVFNEGDVVALAGTANDVEDGNIDTTIQWTSSLSGFLGTGIDVQTPLSVGSHVITASITDASGVTVTQSVTIHINALPVLTLLSPQDGVVFNEGDVVALAGTANDVEDGNIDTTIQWTSSLSGFLGTGIDVQTPLSVGSHVITASITDTAGVTVTQSVTIHINALPTLTLQSPLNGALYMLHETVELRGTANDLEDGDISETIQWSSDIDGVLGTGAVLIKTLSLGVHTVTASITDTNGSTRLLTTQLVIDQIDLGLTVSGKGRKKTATLSWSGSRTLVDIYKNGVVVGAAANAGTAKYRFRNQALFKVCETGTNYCSVEILAQQVR